MKIETRSLSKDTLAKIVDFMRPHPLTDEALASVLYTELCIEVGKIPGKQAALDKKITAMKVTNRSPQKKIKAHNELVSKYNRLGIRGNTLLEKIKELEAAYPKVKKEETS